MYLDRSFPYQFLDYQIQSQHYKFKIIDYYQLIESMFSKEPNLRYCFARNNGERQSLIKLIQFKTIISKALPNMDKPHIVRLLFDYRHECLIAYEDKQIIGGTCFAAFESQKFAQLAFLAVRAQKRIQGYGKRIMNKLKSVLQARRMSYIITYGDNMALGFFRKQGFSEKITMAKEKWEGFIKQYDGGKLMECKIHPTVDYINIDKIIQMQKKHVIEIIKRNSFNQTKFEISLKEQDSSQTQIFFQRKTKDGQVENFRRDPRQIPGVIESGWNWEEHDLIKQSNIQSFHVRSKKLIESIKRYPDAKHFLQPVSSKQVPNYHTIIKQPMDISTIYEKICSHEYKDQEHLCQDIELIFANCMQFNHPDSVYFKSAVRLRYLTATELQAFKHAFISTPQTSK